MEEFLSAIEKFMSLVRKFKLYVTIAGTLSATMAYGIIYITNAVMIGFADAGEAIFAHLSKNQALTIITSITVGFLVSKFYSQGQKETPLENWIPNVLIYLFVGLVFMGGIFYAIPMLMHMLAIVLLSPLLSLLASFFNGTAVVSLKLLGKILFIIYLISFMVDLSIKYFAKGIHPLPAIIGMVEKYWKELLDVFHNLWDLLMSPSNRSTSDR